MSGANRLVISAVAYVLVCGCAPHATAPPTQRAVEVMEPVGSALHARVMPPDAELEPFKVVHTSRRRVTLVQHNEHVLHQRAAVVLEDGRLGVFRFSDHDESLPTHRWEAAIHSAMGVVGVISLGGEGSVAVLQVVRFDEPSGRWVALGQLEPPYHMSELVRLVAIREDALLLEVKVEDCSGCGLEGDYVYQSVDRGQSWRLLGAP